MSNAVRPEGEMTLTLCDIDFCDLVAQSLDENILYTGGYKQKVTVVVEDIKMVMKGGDITWELLFCINVKEEEE